MYIPPHMLLAIFHKVVCCDVLAWYLTNQSSLVPNNTALSVTSLKDSLSVEVQQGRYNSCS